MASADAPVAGQPGGPSMAVVSPDAGSLAVAGEVYTVEVSFFFFFLCAIGVRGECWQVLASVGLFFVGLYS